MSEKPSDFVDRQLCNQLMCAQQKAWNQRFEDAGTAIRLARETIEQRMNASRELLDRVEHDLRQLRDWRNEMLGRMWLVGALIFSIQVAIAVFVFLRK